MARSYYSQNLITFLNEGSSSILGQLVKNHQFALEEQQRNAWIHQIQILKESLQTFLSGHILFEYTIPRMGKRVDVVFIYSSLVFVLEFKVGEREYPGYAVDQVLDYALDLKNFHERSHNIPIVPVIIATGARPVPNKIESYADNVFKPIKGNKESLKQIINSFASEIEGDNIDTMAWENSLYKPTPTIIEAAQALYRGHSVEEISRSDSGAIKI